MTVQVTGTLSATGHSGSFVPQVQLVNGGEFNVSVWGTFSATVRVERSFDSGVTWLPLTGGGSAAYTYTAPASETIGGPEAGVMYRVNCTAYTSGTVNYRLSQ